MSGESKFLTLRSKVPADAAGRTLLDHLAQRFRYVTRDGWAERIADGRVTVDGQRVGEDHVLRRGECVAYRRPADEPDAPTDVRIVHDVAGVVVVDKPAGLPVHGDGAFITRTVVGVLARRLGARLRPVHRLDRETSGLCVLARDRATARALQDVVVAGGFTKTYDALVHGVVTAATQTIAAPIGRAPTSVVSIRRAALSPGAPDADPAETEIIVRACGRDATWVECRPVTGRTHQIRVHLESVGHPLLGDKLYGRSDTDFLAWVTAVKSGGTVPEPDGVARQMLHARALTFTEPRSGERFAFEAPWPDDFVAVARAHGIRVAGS